MAGRHRVRGRRHHECGDTDARAVGAGVWALAFGALAGSAPARGAVDLRGRFRPPALDLRGIGALVRFGGAWSATRFAWQLNYQADVLIAGRFLSQEAVGLYSVAVNLANMPLQKAMSIINPIAFPALSKLRQDCPICGVASSRRDPIAGVRNHPVAVGLRSLSRPSWCRRAGPGWAGVICHCGSSPSWRRCDRCDVVQLPLFRIGRRRSSWSIRWFGSSFSLPRFSTGVWSGSRRPFGRLLDGVCLSFAITFPDLPRRRASSSVGVRRGESLFDRGRRRGCFSSSTFWVFRSKTFRKVAAPGARSCRAVTHIARAFGARSVDLARALGWWRRA